MGDREASECGSTREPVLKKREDVTIRVTLVAEQSGASTCGVGKADSDATRNCSTAIPILPGVGEDGSYGLYGPNYTATSCLNCCEGDLVETGSVSSVG